MEKESENNSIYYGCIEKTIRNNNIELYNNIISYNDNIITFKEKFYLYENNIELPICECGNSVKFIDMRSGFREFCSKKCMYNSKKIKEQRKNTNLDKYGVDNPSKSNFIKGKVRNTNLDKFGVEYPLQSEDIVNKSKSTFIKNYGVDNPSKIRDIREKAELTMLDKYGVRHAMQNDKIKSNFKMLLIDKYGVDNPSKFREFREKAENTMMERYGFKHALQNVNIFNKLKSTMFDRYGVFNYFNSEFYKDNIQYLKFSKNNHIVSAHGFKLKELNNTEYILLCDDCNSNFSINRQLWRNRIYNKTKICLICNPITNKSNKEIELFDFIKSNYYGSLSSDRTVLNGKELDIYLPELDLAFEFNGLYWHSDLHKDKNYHLNKTNECLSKNINLIHIWEDDWNFKQDIVKSIILNKLGKSKKIFARKCEIRNVNNKDVKNFLINNHIQGFVGSNIKLGLYYNDELVSLMTFGNLRRSLGQLSLEGSYELLRFCNKLGYSNIGGASKLFKHFLNNYDVKEVISYSDNSRGFGNLYNKLKFEYSHDTVPNYYWCKDGVKHHRFSYRKDKLVKEGYDPNKTEVQIMSERGYYRIFDCGSKKWVYKT